LPIALLVMLHSCNIYKQIPEKKSVLVSNQIEVIGQEKDLINDFFYKDDIYKILVQKPNKRIFGIPVSQHIWAYFNQKKVTKTTQVLKTKVGNPPVLFDSSKIETSRLALENYYFNIGHLDNTVTAIYKTEEKKTKVRYIITPNTPYKIGKIQYDTITQIQKDIFKENYQSYIQEGDIFNITNFINEIDRLTLVANNKGYFTFNKEFIKFDFDTFKNTHILDVNFRLLEESDSSSFAKYRVDSVYVILNSITENLTSTKNELTNYENVRFFQWLPKRYNEKFLSRFINKYHDSFYSKGDINYTIQRLSELSNFKLINSSVNIKDKENRVLDLIYSLRPFPQRSISFGQYVYGSTLGFLGAQPTLTFLNRNLTGKADKLNLSLSGALEFNTYINQNKNYAGLISRTDISVLGNYSIEKFIIPLLFSNNAKYLYNRSNLNAQYSYSRRLGYYDIHTIGITGSYEWAKNRATSYTYSPLLFNMIIFPEKSVTDDFKKTLALNPFLRSTFNNTFILGSSFTLGYNNQYGRKKTNSLSMKFNLETAGNTSYITNQIFNFSDGKNGIDIGGINISQYLKSQFEFTNAYKINRITSLHFRSKFGIAFPYGNSDKLPYIKQFFIGGPYSIRAFQPRTIGPGNFKPNIVGVDTGTNPPDQLGNMVFEANAEYRFNIISFFKGALFMDAGNIWNTSIDYSQSDLSVFKIDEFYKQLYIGGGFGLRADLEYFIMRFDIGVPFRIPYLTKNDWVITDAKPYNPTWISNNLVFNFAVGYPF
jgi:outer membrane protein insertion porin family